MLKRWIRGREQEEGPVPISKRAQGRKNNNERRMVRMLLLVREGRDRGREFRVT